MRLQTEVFPGASQGRLSRPGRAQPQHGVATAAQVAILASTLITAELEVEKS